MHYKAATILKVPQKSRKCPANVPWKGCDRAWASTRFGGYGIELYPWLKAITAAVLLPVSPPGEDRTAKNPDETMDARMDMIFEVENIEKNVMPFWPFEEPELDVD